MSKEFYETRKIFREYINYKAPYSYEEWMSLPEENKAAALYVQYFDEIILAWFKSKSFYASEQEGVETVCQYLMKNVPVIEDNPKRFNKKYIYRVSYNCLYCIAHDRISDRLRWELEGSNICAGEGSDEVDLFDTFIIDETKRDDELAEERAAMWRVIESMGDDIVQVVGHLLDGERLPKGVSYVKKRKVIEHLQKALEDFKDTFYI